MVRETSRRNSKVSIISVDPAVASHITGGSKLISHAAHARTESSPAAQTTTTPLAAASKGHSRTASAPHRNVKKRSNSLRRAKNSTELLRSIQAERNNNKQVDAPGVKRGRNFTVSNVSTGGLLHLSPSPHQQLSPVVTSPPPFPWTQPSTAVLLSTTNDSAPIFHNRTRSVSPKRLLGRAVQAKASKELNRVHYRSQSFSTIDESRKSVVAALQPKTLKIIINRQDSPHSSDDEEVPPTLQIPIPHYKLGTPRFSAHGTPFIRGSSYTRGSELPSTGHSSMTDGIRGPPPASAKALSKLQYSLPFEERVVPMPDPLRVAKPSDKQRTASAASYVSPISAEIYDRLLEVYDDPFVVRYANNEKEIAAATKIRIIAQISSESFMDYDLVSDFFLTFRSYMTTFEVLDYLLARLKWSISRLSEDGRIIRIRTFAALRHWILNYFAEDFVVNRHLRVRFCQEVNELYESVKQRPRGVGGVSDLKILQDLKRCWNGRCALYWDAEEFNMDSNQEEPLLPGGVLGSRNPAFADISEATAALGLGIQDMPPSPLPSASSRTSRKTAHKRLPSSDYAKKPLSIESEKSLQATSCSLPRYHSRSPDKDEPALGRAPQPVSVLCRRQNAPSDLKVNTHGRSTSQEQTQDVGQSMDSSRGQTSVEVLVNSGYYVDPHAGSMIRGFVYGPVEPFVQLPTNPPLSPSVRFSTDQKSSGSSRIPMSPRNAMYQPQGPAVKNIFGSIRRAISGKQGTNEVTLITVSDSRPSTSGTRSRATIPLNMAKSNDDLRRKVAGVPAKTQLRIDLLCAAAVQSFQTAVPGMPTTQETSIAPTTQQLRSSPAQRAPLGAPFPRPSSNPDDSQQIHPSRRLPSHYTARSGSILIVDDTAVAMPVMSGALPDSYVIQDQHPDVNSPNMNPYFRRQHESFETKIASKTSGNSSESRLNEHIIGLAQTTSLDVPFEGPNGRSTTSSAVTIRKIESPSTEEEHEKAVPTESLRTNSPPPMTEATSNSESPISKAPAHGLRRRPGGDLKKNHNVHDLEAPFHHESLDSMLDSNSYTGSVLITNNPATTTRTANKHKKSQKVSMINTHSSQHLRPSFEAAVAGFSAIPDEDDGGLEATLMKLEGNYDGKSPDLSSRSRSPQSVTSAGLLPFAGTNNNDETKHIGATSFLYDENVDPNNIRSAPKRLLHQSAVFGLPTESPAGSDSEDSEISLPILGRNTSIGRAVTTDSLNSTDKFAGNNADEARSDSDILEARRAASHELARPTTAHTEGVRSFLLDEDENLTDLSSEISVDILSYSETAGKPLSPMLAAPGTAISGLEIPSHPLTHASLVNLSMHTSPNLTGGSSFGTQLPTPQQSPVLVQSDSGRTIAIRQDRALETSPAGQLALTIAPGPAHVPFILACDSQALAQQLTIVEQSALTEIEWNDLVEMRWNNDSSTNTLDWAEYMAKYDDARGIDVVITRFNLVTKWAQSEVVLTRDIEERARVLSKLIHVAAHARRLHNYATMLQIIFALVSTSCSRLKKTWELVPGPDQTLYKHMEPLAMPKRNFHDLRAEMESTDLSTGCVPFIGLYVHDLNYNAQKPAEIQIEGSPEPLVNFERFRTAAVIIKGLLRLIDASLRYDFEPIHGIIERCLWMSALADDRINALSKALEP